MKLQIGCLIITLYIMGIYHAVKRIKTNSHIVFSELLVVSVLYMVADMTTVYTVNHLETVPQIWNQIAHRIFLILLVASLFLIFGYIYILVYEGRIIKRKWKVLLWTDMLLCAVLPLHFVETPNGNYSDGLAAYMAYASVALYTGGSLYMLLRYWKSIEDRKKKIILLAIVSQIAVSVYQAFNPLSLISCLGITVVSLSFFLTVESPDILLIERLREEREKANAANQAKSTFLAHMSHEIRTPINAVIGMNEMILRESKEKPVKEYAWEVKSASRQLLSVVNDILDLSKIESGKMEIMPAEYELPLLITDLVNMISARANAKKLELKVMVDEELPSVLYGDDVRLRQIVTNLLTNAVKYTAAGSVTLQVNGQRAGENVMLHVKVEDTGSGIKPEDMRRLFAEYERIEEDKNRNVEGTGLGMNITVQLLEMMGSKLEVKSEYGKGSAFEFCVSQRIVRDEKIGNLEQRIQQTAHEYSYSSTFIAPDARILIVDDNAVNRMVFMNLLKQTKVQMEEASCGTECLEKTEQQYFDLIFLDHMMPDMDGMQTFQKIRDSETNQCKCAPIIIFTANAVKGEKEKYLQAGFDGFLAKPVNPVKLEKMIRQMLPAEMVKQEVVVEAAEELADEQMAGILPDIEGFNWDYARMYVKSDDMILESVKSFAAALGAEIKHLEKLSRDLSEKDTLEQYRIKVHALKSSTAMLGAVGISELAKLLEYAAKDNALDRIMSLQPIFIEELEKCREHLSVFSDTSEKPKIEDVQKFLGWIEMLRSSIINVDIDAADEIIEQINAFRYDSPVHEKVEALSEAVMNMNDEECLTICASLTEYLTKR